MSWLFKSFQSDDPDSSEQDHDDHSSSTTPRGIKDDLSALSQSLSPHKFDTPTHGWQQDPVNYANMILSGDFFFFCY